MALSKKEIQEIKVVIALIILSALMALGIMYLVHKSNGSEPTITSTSCDSLQNELMEMKIELGRNEIIIERLIEHDSTAVIEAMKNLE